MDDVSRPAWQQLLETGILVQFRILDTHTESAPDKESVAVRADLIFTGDDADTEPSEVAEWGACGFLYTVALLSFDDARPRGYSENDFLAKDNFTAGDFFECLSYRNGELHLGIDYVRGRCMKTDITVRPDGTATLQTWGRGQTALRWLDRLQGKKKLALVL